MVEDFEAKNDQKLIWGSIKTVIFFNVSFFLQNGEKAFFFQDRRVQRVNTIQN